MADIPANVLPRLRTWWASLEAGTQAIFEAIYMEAPAAVSKAVSGGQWEADGAEPGLAALLGTDADGAHDAYRSIPRLVKTGDPTVTPFHAAVGQKVTIDWTEHNDSQADLGAYFTDIYVSGPDGDVAGSARLPGDGVKAGAIAQRRWEFEGAKSGGQHSVMIYMNAEGTDPGSGVPGEQGFRGSAGAQFDVGGGEAAAGGQNEDALGAVMNAFRNATSSLTEDDYYAQLSEGVNWFAAIDTLDAGSQAALGRLGGAVQSRARGNVGEGQLFMNPNEVSDDHAREMLVERQAGLQSARTTMLGLLAQPLDPRKPDDMARLLAAAEALANA